MKAFSLKEIKYLFLFSIILGAMFTFFYSKIEINSSFSKDFLIITSFILFLTFVRVYIMKIYSFHQGFDMVVCKNWLNSFWFEEWDKITSKQNTGESFVFYIRMFLKLLNPFDKEISTKGLPTYLLAIFLNIITFGYFVYPLIWRYEIKKIESKFIGTESYLERELWEVPVYDVTNLRISRSIFLGNFVFFIFLIVFGTMNKSGQYYELFIFLILYLAIFEFIPVFGNNYNYGGQSTIYGLGAFLSFLLLLFGSIFITLTNSITLIFIFSLLFTLIGFIYLWVIKN